MISLAKKIFIFKILILKTWLIPAFRDKNERKGSAKTETQGRKIKGL